MKCRVVESEGSKSLSEQIHASWHVSLENKNNRSTITETVQLTSTLRISYDFRCDFTRARHLVDVEWGGLRQGREKTTTLKCPISARHSIDSSVIVRPQFHVSQSSFLNRQKWFPSTCWLDYSVSCRWVTLRRRRTMPNIPIRIASSSTSIFGQPRRIDADALSGPDTLGVVQPKHHLASRS